jgi:hypothetical protein
MIIGYSGQMFFGGETYIKLYNKKGYILEYCHSSVPNMIPRCK